MIEQRERLPIDLESVRYHKKYEMIYALGRDKYRGIAFGFMENCGDNSQSALDKAKRMSENNDVDTFVVGPGIDEEESDRQQKVVYRNDELGIWGNTFNPQLIAWLEGELRSKHGQI